MALYDSAFYGTVFYDEVSPPPTTGKKRMAQFALKLDSLKLNEKIVLCQEVETKLTGNANVPTPNPAIAALTAKRTATIAKRDALVAARATVTQLEGELATLEGELGDLLTTEAA